MKTIIKATIFILAVFLSVTFVKAQPLHEYFFIGNLTGTGGGPTLTQNLACAAPAGAFGTQTVAVVGQTCSTSDVFCFNDGGGLTYPNPSYITNNYSINLFFKFNTLGGYARIIDFRNSTSDNGGYLLNNCLNFYPNGNVGTCPNFVANTYYLFTFVRVGATNVVTVYVNGVLFTTYNDAANDYACATNVTPINFFRDDNPVPCEAQPGCIRYASVSSATVSAGQVLTTFTNICNIILPVELSSFNANKENGRVKLNWTTLSESKNKAFEIERSVDGINFTKIGEVKGSGDSRQKKEYNYFDNFPEVGVNYYRLLQIDFDGTFGYSNIASVAFENDAPLFYPNPACDRLIFKNINPNSIIKIKDVLGRGVLQLTDKLLPESKEISVSGLPEGTYFVFVNEIVQKLVISR